MINCSLLLKNNSKYLSSLSFYTILTIIYSPSPSFHSHSFNSSLDNMAPPLNVCIFHRQIGWNGCCLILLIQKHLDSIEFTISVHPKLFVAIHSHQFTHPSLVQIRRRQDLPWCPFIILIGQMMYIQIFHGIEG